MKLRSAYFVVVFVSWLGPWPMVSAQEIFSSYSRERAEAYARERTRKEREDALMTTGGTIPSAGVATYSVIDDGPDRTGRRVYRVVWSAPEVEERARQHAEAGRVKEIANPCQNCEGRGKILYAVFQGMADRVPWVDRPNFGHNVSDCAECNGSGVTTSKRGQNNKDTSQTNLSNANARNPDGSVHLGEKSRKAIARYKREIQDQQRAADQALKQGTGNVSSGGARTSAEIAICLADYDRHIEEIKRLRAALDAAENGELEND
jgi:hypothetical protein